VFLTFKIPLMKTNYSVSILVIDDDLVSRFVHKKLIASLNIDVLHYEAGNGKKALDLISGKESPMPDIILCDINMPVMDGIEFIKEFKKLQGHENTQLIIVSSSQSLVDINKIHSLGVEQIISKPLTRSFLESVICETLLLAAA
jgi:CheY-like chemotaxis protein